MFLGTTTQDVPVEARYAHDVILSLILRSCQEVPYSGNVLYIGRENDGYDWHDPYIHISRSPC